MGISLRDADLYSLRDLLNAINGFRKKELRTAEKARDVVYGAARWHAANTAWSEKQSNQIRRHKFPWEKGRKSKSNEPLDYDKVMPVLEKALT